MKELHRHGIPPERIARSVVQLVPSGVRYSASAFARITLNGLVVTSKGFRETPLRMAAEITVRGRSAGTVEVCYSEDVVDGDADPFLKEEHILLDAIADQLSLSLDHSASEDELFRSRELARSLVDAFPGAAVLLDLDLRVVAINLAAASLVGRASTDAVGMECGRLFDEGRWDSIERALQRVASTGGALERYEEWDGRVYSFSMQPVVGSDEAVERLAVFVRDVTEEKRRENDVRQSEAKYRSVFELSPEAIVLLNKRGNVVDANGRIADWLGYSKDEIVGKNILFLPFIPKETKARIMKRFLERMAGRTIQPYDVTFVTKNGDEKVGRIHGTVLVDEDGRGTHDLVMISDVTEQKRAEIAMTEAGRKLEELHGVVKRLAACADTAEIYPLITGAAREILSIDACGFFVAEEGRLSLAATCCHGRESNPDPVPVEKAGHLGKAYLTGRMQLFSKDDVGEGMPAPEGFERGLSMPAEGLGVLHCFSTKPGAFTTDDVRMLDLLLDHAKQAAGRIALERRLHEEAVRDQLTGLYNRHYFDEAATREVERARRSGEPIGFLMVDIDRFKSVNDTYGHVMGDDVLRGVARFLAAQVRTAEIVVRYGGDEFLIMMPGMTGEPGPVCERFQAAFAAWRAGSGIPDEIEFGLSLGFARWEPYDLASITETIAEADEAMYSDKRRHAAERAHRGTPADKASSAGVH
jgi:diguanylate cyclase (GGDEF)-like protein/PAS domain S-box-containing protein